MKDLSKHYDQLTPKERLALALAAVEREDETELARLTRPYRTYVGSACALDYLELERRTREHHASQLALAARFWQAAFCLANDRDNPAIRRMLDQVAAGYRAGLAEWERYCARVPMHPDLLLAGLPGFDALKLLETSEVVRLLAAAATEVLMEGDNA
jgi:hypothetical protein